MVPYNHTPASDSRFLFRSMSPHVFFKASSSNTASSSASPLYYCITLEKVWLSTDHCNTWQEVAPFASKFEWKPPRHGFCFAYSKLDHSLYVFGGEGERIEGSYESKIFSTSALWKLDLQTLLWELVYMDPKEQIKKAKQQQQQAQQQQQQVQQLEKSPIARYMAVCALLKEQTTW